jgi:hypothetical protein
MTNTNTRGYSITAGANTAHILDVLPINMMGTAALKDTAARLNCYFFTPDATRFFKSRYGATIYGNRYFVSSEQGPDNIRRWSVREFSFGTYMRDDGREIIRMAVESFGEFGAYRDGRAAVAAIRALLAA